MSFALLSILAACSDYAVNKTGDIIVGGEDDAVPDIEVDPTQIDFGTVQVGTDASVSRVVNVSNVGEAALQLSALRLEDTTAPFTFSALSNVLVEPAGTANFTVTFDPVTAVDANTRVFIPSNDPVDAEVAVRLTGLGTAPAISVSPVSYDFGEPYVGCPESLPITIANVGTAPLEVSRLDYVTASNDLSLDRNDDVNGALPWSIEPGASVEVYVDYAPIDEYSDEGYLAVTSNDPLRPSTQASQSATGRIAGRNLDNYVQPTQSSSDILFIVDNSCSMSEEQSSLVANFSAFIEQFTESAVDYQIGVITTDNASFRGDIVTPDMSDPVGEFVAQANAGISGSGDERGMEMAYNSTQSGEDAGPGSDFLRDDARLVFVLVSDEVDSSRDSWSDYLDYFHTLKDDEDDVIWHSIAGDYPSGCATADAGIGYYQITSATGGLYLSICATDWASYLEALAEESGANLDEFELTQYPVPETIEVRVNGLSVSVGWEYDPAGNAVVFDETSIPEGGATVEIEYGLYGDCER